MTKKLKRMNHLEKIRKNLVTIMIVAAVAITGSLLLVITHAATPTAAVEPDMGTVTSPAKVVSDSAASNAQAIKFGAPVAAPSLKPPLQGLVDRGNANGLSSFNLPSEPYLDSLQAVIANVYWSDLQPNAQGQAIQTNQLDSALAAVTAYNNTHANHLSVKLRIFAGIYAPNWAKTIDGWAPVSTYNIQTPTKGGTLGPFWTADYGTAYKQMMQAMAAKYDSNPLLREVTIAQCMTVFAEPFQRDNYNLGQLLYASAQPSYTGTPYSVAADEGCLNAEIDNSTAWTQTRLSLAFNPWRPWSFNGTTYVQGAQDEAFTASVMDHCRVVLKTQCTIENNSIRDTFVGNQSIVGNLYYDMANRGPNMTLQTADPTRIGNPITTVQWATTIGANAVELPNNYTGLTTSDLDSLSPGLLANPIK